MALEQRSFALPLAAALLGLVIPQLMAADAAAQADAAAPDPFALQIHGFASQGFFLTTENNYLTESKRGSFEFTEVGVNLTKPLTEGLRVGIQLFSRDLGEIGDYSVKADWFYLDYRFRDWLGFRAGRVKLPAGLYNEVHDIDSARVPILLPPSVYPVANRDYLLAQTGFELYGYLSLERAGALDYRLYGGTIFLDESSGEPNPAYSLTEVQVPYVVGGRLIYETPLSGLRAGFSMQALRLDLDLAVEPAVQMALQAAGALPGTFGGTIFAELPILLWIASIEYTAYDLQITFEFSRWDVSLESDTQAIIPDTAIMNERMYGMISYRLTSWFTPAFYYAQYYPDIANRDGRQSKQRDWSLTLRFDINEHWLVKLEGHVLDGTAQLNRRLNDDTPAARLERHWLMFLAKTTAHF